MIKLKIVFWISTLSIFILQGIYPVLFFKTEEAGQLMEKLGYPEYFMITLVVFKFLGALVLILPLRSRILKEWSYAGFTFTFILAFISNFSKFGFNKGALLSIIFIIFLVISYVSLSIIRERNKEQHQRIPFYKGVINVLNS